MPDLLLLGDIFTTQSLLASWFSLVCLGEEVWACGAENVALS